jgi:hypothetical protein
MLVFKTGKHPIRITEAPEAVVHHTTTMATTVTSTQVTTVTDITTRAEWKMKMILKILMTSTTWIATKKILMMSIHQEMSLE